MKKSIFLFITLFSFYISYPQDVPDPIKLKNQIPGSEMTATPDVSAFHKYNFLPTNLYTGTINIEIPIFEIKSGNINTPISISYDARGVKIDEYASSVGMGWNLNAGGSVTKIVNDIEDFDYSIGSWTEEDFDYGFYTEYYVSSYGSKTDLSQFFGNFSQYGKLPDPFDEGGSGGLGSGGTGTNISSDASPDLFLANAPGLSSKFIVNKTISGNYLPFELSPSGTYFEEVLRTQDRDFNFIGFRRDELQGVSFLPADWLIGQLLSIADNSYAEDYNIFNMTNSKGIKYKFGTNSDISESISTTSQGLFYPPSEYDAINEAKSLEVDQYRINKNTWFLDEISDPKTNKKISFEYEQYSNDKKEVFKKYFDDTFTDDLSSYSGLFLTSFPNYFRDLNPPPLSEAFVKRQKIYTKSPRLNRIKRISFDEGEVLFYYDFERSDIVGQQALSKVVVKNSYGQIIKIVEFIYSYFYSGTSCDQGKDDYLRLKLKRVVFKDKNNNFVNDYNMDYYFPDSLPKKNSLEQDFLGYYNANGADLINESLKVPRLYFHENQGRFSILPFPLSNFSSQTISTPSDYSIVPNPSTSYYGCLKKITYPTGGSSEFEYEPHYFRLLGADYIGGGARIKSQKLSDGEGEYYFKKYYYLNDQGNSSGSINNIPVYGALLTHSLSTNQNSFLVYGKSKNSLELTNGSFIGYSKVIEEEVSSSGEINGRIEYTYSNPEQYPNQYPELTNIFVDDGINADGEVNYLINNSNFPYVGYVDNDIRRGKLESKKVYDSENNILSKEEFQYQYRVFNNETILLEFKKSINQYWDQGSTFPYSMNLSFESEIPVAQNLYSHKTTTEYLNNQTIISEEFFEYDNQFPFLKNKIVTASQDNKRYLYELSYPKDLIGQESFMNELILDNRISEPIQVKSYITDNNGENQMLLSVNKNEYNSFNNKIQLYKNGTSKSDNPIENLTYYYNYDIYGNPTEISQTNGVHNSYIWGYKGEQLVAKIINATYSQVTNPSIGVNMAVIDNPQSPEDLEFEINKIRLALQDSQVTTYSYIPLIGIIGITDPNGKKIHYQYDDSNRLKTVLDKDLNLLKDFTYNYRSVDSGYIGGLNYPNLLHISNLYVTGSAGNPLSSYLLHLNFCGGSGNLTFNWYYSLDGGFDFTYMGSTNTEFFEFQYDIGNTNYCPVNDNVMIIFKCEVEDNTTNQDPVFELSQQIIINCSGINH
jgi:YD repeat-containing protein